MATNFSAQPSAGGLLPAEVTTMTTIRQAPPLAVTPGAVTWDNASGRTVIVGNVTTTVTKRSRLWAGCAEIARRAGRAMVRYRYELAPLGAVGVLDTAAWWQYADGAGPGTIAVYSTLGALSAAGAVLGMKHKHPHIAHATAGLTLVFGDVAAGVADGPGPASFIATAITTGLAYAFYGKWLTESRHQRMKLHVDTVKAKGAVPAAMGLEAADPGLIGSSPEETALRRAIHALTGATPQEVQAFHHNDNGWTALVAMPPGRNTSPDAIIKKRVQLAANLGLPGQLHLTRGDNNQLVVRLVTSDALAGTIPYEDDRGRSMADPVQLGRDEHGQPVKIILLYRHTLVAGASDWGKSGLVNLIIKKNVRRADVDLVGADLKPGTVELGPWQPYFARPIASTVEEVRDLFDWLEAECHRRGEKLRQLTQEQLARGGKPVRKWVPGVHGNGIIVIIDELAELIRQDEALRKLEAEWRKADPEGYPMRRPLADQYESLLALCRFLAISMVAATQQPSRKVFGGSTDARGNYTNRISTRMGESGHAQFVFGADARSKGWKPELLDAPGKFLVCSPELDNQEPRVCRAEYVTDADIAADVAPLHARESRMAAVNALGAPLAPEGFPFQKPPVESVRMVKAAAPALRYPDGSVVDVQPDLWRLFVKMQPTTKEELTIAGPFASRDTVRRALEVWMEHGVASRKEGRAEKFYIPGEEADGE